VPVPALLLIAWLIIMLPAEESVSVAVSPEPHVTPPVLAPPIVILPDVPVEYV